MAVLRALPNRAWSAVVALVVLASLGVAIVLGAGLDAWRSTVSGPQYGSTQGLHPGVGPGVITLPAGPHDSTGPTTPDTAGNDGGSLGPVVSEPGAPEGPSTQPGGPTGPEAPGPSNPGPSDEPTSEPGTPATGHPGVPAVDGPELHPLPGGHTSKPAVDGVRCGLGPIMRQLAHRLDVLGGTVRGHLKLRLLGEAGCGHAYGHSKQHGSAKAHAKHHKHAK